MKRVLFSSRSQFSFRLLTSICAIVVSSYVLFDYLDLDGSDWRKAQYPGSGNVFVLTEPIEIKPTSLSQFHDRWELVYEHFTSLLQGPTCFLVISETRISGLAASRHRAYRVALPRSSISDLLPVA